MIGIIVAMNTELEAIRALLENEKETPYYSQKYYSGIISGKEVTMVEGGIGKVAAAITCIRLIVSGVADGHPLGQLTLDLDGMCLAIIGNGLVPEGNV